MPAPVSQISVPAEERFILAALRGQPLTQEAVDVERLVRLAHWHGVAPLVHQAVLAGNAKACESLLTPLLQEARRVRRDNMLLLDRLSRLHELFLSAGLETLLLKGGALIPLVYKSEADRPMADIDLLIRERDWPKLKEVMEASGDYVWPERQVESRRLQYFHKLEIATAEKPASVFEFHTSLEVAGRRSLQTDACFQRAVPVEFMERRFMRLCDEDLALHLTIHAARHFSQPRLIWVYDLFLMARAGLLNWPAQRNAAQKIGSQTAACFALSYLEKVFPGTVPANELALLQPGVMRRRAIASFATSNPLLPTRDIWGARDRWLFALMLLDGTFTRMKFLAKHFYRRFVLGSAEH